MNNTLPKWDLSHLVPHPAERNIRKMLEAARKKARSFQKAHEGRLATLSPARFGQALAVYEAINEEISRVYNYAQLDRQTKLDDAKTGKLFQGVMEETNDISSHLLFFRLEINRLPDGVLKKLMKDKTAARYAPFVAQLRAFRKHQLSDEVEKVLHERSVTATPAWIRLFDETMSRLRFDVNGRKITETEVFHLLQSRDAKTRERAAAAIEKTLGGNIGTFAFILNTMAKEKDVDEKQRGFKTITQARNLENQVEDEVVEALVSAVRGSYKRLSHRYYRLKAGWMGKKKIPYWDRNAPLPFSANRRFTWREGKAAVLDAYGAFHPVMRDTAARFFDEGWIDAAPRAGKDSGAFSAPCVPSVHPYVLMNYKNDIGDVMTLAHELGHGVHQVLAGKQGYLMADTPLTLAETASVFGEMLTFQSLLKREKNPTARMALLAKKVEDMLNTVVRQVAFHEFERRFHTERKKGEVTADRICDIWMEVMKESLGPAFDFREGYKYYWAYISHFYHVPFYVYAYAFGDCLVNALYGAYLDSGKDFPAKYLKLLEAGGTKRHRELLKPFGLDARDPKFWRRGLSLIESFIDELESAKVAPKRRKTRKTTGKKKK